MQASDIPGRLPLPFAESGLRAAIPIVPSGVPGRASLEEGFPPETMQPVAAGGIPPAGQDFNGILNEISAWARWQGAGGPVPYDASFATAIGGYPKGAVVAGAVAGGSWVSLIDNNTSDPDAGGAGWLRYSSGRLLNVQIFTASANYTPTPGTKSIIVEVQGPGGGGGGIPATGAGQTAQGGHGSSGAYGMKRFTSGFEAGVPVTPGAGGLGGAPGSIGSNAGPASFGALLSCAGGFGGWTAGPHSTANYTVPLISQAPAPTGALIALAGSLAMQAVTANGFGITPGLAYSARFGASYGAGGSSGAPNFPNSPAAPGLAGLPGIVIVWEFS